VRGLQGRLHDLLQELQRQRLLPAPVNDFRFLLSFLYPSMRPLLPFMSPPPFMSPLPLLSAYLYI
jgi:hypothetical protein